MNTYHWNGEFWWRDDRPLYKRALVWLCWIGGWNILRLYWTDPGSRRAFGIVELATPVSFFGHRITFFGWGWEIRLGQRWLVRVKARRMHDGRVMPASLYLSPDATPAQATTWLSGAPYDVRREGDQNAIESDQWLTRRRRMSA